MRSFKEGDKVKAIILSIDSEKRRISLGLKPSYFDEGDFADSDSHNDDDDDDEHPEFLGVVGDNAMQVDDQPQDLPGQSDGEGDVDASDVDEIMEVEPNVQPAFTSSSAPPTKDVPPVIKLQGGFQWTGQDHPTDHGEHSSSPSDDESEELVGKKKRRRRKEIEQDLTADMHTKIPESTSDFERHLLGSPNSSYMWIQYMSFQLQLSEIDKAREIGKRALQAINFREEQEKMNVWIALLNLENAYGTDESLEVVFKDAARHNDSKTIHLRLAAILDHSEKYQVCRSLYMPQSSY